MSVCLEPSERILNVSGEAANVPFSLSVQLGLPSRVLPSILQGRVGWEGVVLWLRQKQHLPAYTVKVANLALTTGRAERNLIIPIRLKLMSRKLWGNH